MAKAPLIYTKEALQDLLDIADYHFEKVGGRVCVAGRW